MFKSYFTTLILATTVAVAQAAMPATAGSDGTGAIDYLFEDFEGGTPAGWDLSTFYMAGGGVDGSLALINETYIGDSYILTPQVNLGDDPIIEFYYQVFGMRFMETDVTHPANPDYVNFYVEVSEDAGVTWNTVYSIKPEGGDACHVTSSDFTQVSVPIRQYAGKTCQVRLSLPYFLDYTTLDYCRYIFDNISVGTRPSVDMAVYGLTGTAFPKNNVANEYSVTISNKGVNANSSYSVKIVDRDGNEIADIPAAKMESQEEKVFSFTWSPVKQGQTEIKAIVEVDGDNNLSDNETPWMHIDVIDDDTESLTVGTSSHKPKYSLPVNFYSRNNYIQMIYSANVLQMGMTIRGLRYDTDFALATQSCDFKVYIGETDKKDFSDGEWVDFSQLTEVFDGSVYVDIATQKMELAFSKPYQYMGKNLVVCVYRQDKDFYSNLLFHVDESAQFAAAAMGRESDSEVLSPENPGEGIVYDYMPVTTFVADVAATGSVGGKITNSQGNGIQGVDVSIKETGHTTTSDAEGNYSIEGLAPGIYSMQFSAYGYNVAEATATVEAEKASIVDVNLKELQEMTVSGVVMNAAGKPIKDATVQILGYINRKATTGADGHFTISGLLCDGTEYTVRASAPYFKTFEQKRDIQADIDGIEITLEDYLDKPYEVNVEQADGKASISWGEPLRYVHYDGPNQQVIDYAGFDGWYYSVIGTAFDRNMELHEIQWFCTDYNNSHEIINIWIFPLDEIGWPTYETQIARIDNVPNIDNQWNSYKFETPLKTPSNGFFIGLNCGNRGVDVCMVPGTDEYPVGPGRNFGCDDVTAGWVDMHGRFADLYPTFEGNLLIRVVGEDFGEADYNEYQESPFVQSARPGNYGKKLQSISQYGTLTSYDIYRVEEGKTLSEGVLVGQGVTDTNYVDESFSALPNGTSVEYAVVANYFSGQSEAAWSNAIVKNTSGMGNIDVDNPVVRVVVVNVAGIIVYDGKPDDFDEKGFASGVYIVKEIHVDNNVTTSKIIVEN